MDGLSETERPSNVSSQSVGERGVITSRPHPQQHLWATVAYCMEIYTVPSCKTVGMYSTNSCLRTLVGFINFLVDKTVSTYRIYAVMLVIWVVVKAKELFPLDDRKRRVEGVEISNLNVA